MKINFMFLIIYIILYSQGTKEFKFENGIRRTGKQRESSPGAKMYFDSDSGQFKRLGIVKDYIRIFCSDLMCNKDIKG